MNKCKKINLLKENQSSFRLACSKDLTYITSRATSILQEQYSSCWCTAKLNNKNTVALTRHQTNGSNHLDKHGSVRNLSHS